jgi:biopolymer transport protein ExbB
MSFEWKHVILVGWPVLSILLICSVVSLAIALQCWFVLKECRTVGSNRQRLRDLLVLVEQRLAILGTIANAAPFIGLLGTVVGIIRAFHSISMNTGGGISMVAGGISEALISTAAGLAVAIPSSMLYNYYTYLSQRIADDAEIDL